MDVEEELSLGLDACVVTVVDRPSGG